jgi:hypothetical protein
MEEFEYLINLDDEDKYDHFGIDEANFDRNPETLERTEKIEEAVIEIQRTQGILNTDNYKYIGEIVNDQRDGFGICYYKNGTIEASSWKNNLKEGFAKVIYADGTVIQGEIRNDEFDGYCEYMYAYGKTTHKGYYFNKLFKDYITIQSEAYSYEGEVISDRKTSAFGKLVKKKKTFVGEIVNYCEESGYGLHIYDITPKYAFYGEYKNKCFSGYGELYYLDGRAVAGYFNNNTKNGIFFGLQKDGKITITNYDNDLKHGAAIYYSSGTKTSKLEVSLYGWRVKSVDKTWEKYLTLNYPEFTYILNFDHEKMVKRFSSVFTEELSYLNKNYK